jgi:hypothetical protein
MKEIAKYTYDLSQDFDPDVIALSHQAVEGERKAMRARSVMISWEVTGGQADGSLGLGISNDGEHFSVLDNISINIPDSTYQAAFYALNDYVEFIRLIITRNSITAGKLKMIVAYY